MSYDILAVGDMHLADNSWPGRPLFHDSYFILPQLLAVVNKYQPKKIVLCGDIIDRKRTNSRPISELRRFVTSVKKLTGDPDSVYYIQGNHDMADPPWGKVCGATHLHHKMVKVNDLIIGGLDYTMPAHLLPALNGLSCKVQMLFCHQMWAEHKPFGPEPDGSLMDIPEWIDTVVSGDIHKELHRTIARKPHELQFLSPGSTNMQDISEDEVKHVWLIKDHTIKPIRLRTRHVIRLKKCVSEQNVSDAIKKLTRELDAYEPWESKVRYASDIIKPIVDAQYSADLTDFEDRIRTVIADRAFFFPRYYTPDEEKEEFVTSIEWKSQAAAAIKKALREETEDPEILELAETLLARRDKTDEKLKPFLNKYLETGSCK